MNRKITFFVTAFSLISSIAVFAANGATWDKRSYLPFEVIASIADSKLDGWLSRPSEVPEFLLKKPVLGIAPKPETLTKGEFETTQQFETRVALAQRNYDAKILKLQKKFQRGREQYNQAVKEYKLSLEVEKRRRQAAAEDKYWQYVFEAFSKELGEPTIKLIEYNADLGVFYAVLTSSRSLFSQWLAVRIPLEHARNIQNNADQVLPVLRFDKNTRNQLIISNAHVTFGKHKYSTQLINKPDNLSKVVKENINKKPVSNDQQGFLSVN